MPELLEVGRIEKAHGVKGEVIVRLTTNRHERLDQGAELTTNSGVLVVQSSAAHQDRFRVQFVGVSSREAAEALRGTLLYAAPIEDPDELWVHELLGALVVDQDGIERGRVVEVLDNPASDLLQLDSEALVPVQFVVSVVPGERIDVDVPAGLFDLL